MTTDDFWNLGMTADESRATPGPPSLRPWFAVLLILLIKIGGEIIGLFLSWLGPKWPGDVENPSAASGESQDNGLNAYFRHLRLGRIWLPFSPHDGKHTNMVLYNMHRESFLLVTLKPRHMSSF